MMSLSSRLLLLLGFATWAGLAQAAATTKSKSSGSKSKSAATTKSKSSTSASKAKSETESKAKAKDSESSAKPDSPAEKKAEEAVPKEDAPKPPRPAAVSTVSIEQISGFDQYPKQVQSLVQSALALTHLELRYQYGSSEPNNGGMDCSGTIYHVLRFQGLKDVPRQSDEMAMWVDKKSQLHLTPTATDFDSPEFADLKPGDMLFWTNTTATTRKLPVTHVMIYLGKLKGSGKRIIFGASDGRSFSGQRRSGVSVFDFHLPRVEGTARLHGYGPAPGLLPQEATLATASPPAPAASAPAPAKEEPTRKEMPKEPETAAKTPASASAPKEELRKETSVAAVPPKKTESNTESAETKPSAPTTTVASASSKPAEAKEEVRRAVAVNADVPQETTATLAADKDKEAAIKPETTKADEPVKKVASTTTSSKAKSSSSSSKAKSGTASAKKRSSSVSTRRRTPPPPPKSSVERTFDNAVNSVRRFFR